MGNLSFEDACYDRQDIPDFGMPFIAEENYFNSMNGEIEMKKSRQSIINALIQGSMIKMGDFGYDAVSIQDIVKIIKKSKATFYNYFRSKEELVCACLEVIQDVMLTLNKVPEDNVCFKFLASLAMHIDSLTPYLALNLKNLMLFQQKLMGKDEFIKLYGTLIYSNVLYLDERFS